MFSCPHCEYPLTGKAKRHIDHGTAEVTVNCTHCEAVLRIQITTLRDPNYKKLAERGTNKAGAPTTFCPECEVILNLADRNTHKCSKQ